MELARITEVYAAQRLKIEMWDVADASAAGTLTILPPVEYEAAGGTLSSCRFTNTKAGWADSDTSDCSAIVTNADMNGQLLTSHITIPPGHDCDEGSTAGCYVRVRVGLPRRHQRLRPHDRVVELAGDPIRLIE